MALPEHALVLDLNADVLTLDDLELFEEGGFSVRAFKAFMLRHSNWSKAEVGAITIAELKDVAAQIGEQLKGAAVPKVTAPS